MNGKYMQTHTHKHSPFLKGVHVLVKHEKAAKLHFYFYSYRRNRRKNMLGHRGIGESQAVNKEKEAEASG